MMPTAHAHPFLWFRAHSVRRPSIDRTPWMGFPLPAAQLKKKLVRLQSPGPGDLLVLPMWPCDVTWGVNLGIVLHPMVAISHSIQRTDRLWAAEHGCHRNVGWRTFLWHDMIAHAWDHSEGNIKTHKKGTKGTKKAQKAWKGTNATQSKHRKPQWRWHRPIGRQDF